MLGLRRVNLFVVRGRVRSEVYVGRARGVFGRLSQAAGSKDIRASIWGSVTCKWGFSLDLGSLLGCWRVGKG